MMSYAKVDDVTRFPPNAPTTNRLSSSGALAGEASCAPVPILFPFGLRLLACRLNLPSTLEFQVKLWAITVLYPAAMRMLVSSNGETGR